MTYSEQHYYGIEEWDLEHFRRAGEVLASIARRDEAIKDARAALLALYFRDNPKLGER